MGFPSHVWSESFFKTIRDCFGGFMDIDEDTKHKRYWGWARIYVNFAGISFAAMMELIADGLVFKVPLWVETPSWVEEADQNQVGAHRNVEPRQAVTQTMKNPYGGTEE